MTRLPDSEPVLQGLGYDLLQFEERAVKGPNTFNFRTLIREVSPAQTPTTVYEVQLVDQHNNSIKYLGLHKQESGTTPLVVALRLATSARGDITGFNRDKDFFPLQIFLPDARPPDRPKLLRTYFCLEYDLDQADPTKARLDYALLRAVYPQSDGTAGRVSNEIVAAQHPWVLQPVDLAATTKMYFSGKTPQGEPLTPAILDERPVVLSTS